MLYEIYFEPRSAKWRIKLTVLYFAFFPISRVVMVSSEKAPARAMEFSTFELAKEYAVSVGLNEVYEYRNRRGSYSTQVNAHLIHGSQG